MKFLRVAVLAALALLSSTLADETRKYALQEGDIVFTSSARGQGRAIIDATGSRYTHCGIVLIQNGKPMVLEAVEPVSITPLERFVSVSAPGTFMARRLKSPVEPAAYEEAKSWGRSLLGKKYDHQFLWDDERMYCSELVWKIFEKAGIRLCEPNQLGDYALDKPSVRQAIVEKYGSLEKLPKNEKVVAPSDLALSALLIEVPRHK